MATLTRAIYTADLFVAEDSTDKLTAHLLVNPQALLLTINGNANVASTGAEINSDFPIRVTGKRKKGIIARRIVLERIGGTDPNTFPIRRIVPILDPSFYESALVATSPEITYQGQSDWVISGARREIDNLNFG